MQSVLEEFYRGNIKPVERTYQSGENSKQFRALLQEQNEIHNRMTEIFNAEQFALFRKYCDVQARMDVAMQEDLFLYAFRLGMRWEREVFSPRQNAVLEEDF